jgi:hypothetical protein
MEFKSSQQGRMVDEKLPLSLNSKTDVARKDQTYPDCSSDGFKNFLFLP